MVLIWGMWLSYKIRNAPPAYNESKVISWAVYNAMFVTSFFMVFRSVFMTLSQRFCSENLGGCVKLWSYASSRLERAKE